MVGSQSHPHAECDVRRKQRILEQVSTKTNEPTESLTEGTTHKHPADDQVGAQVAAPTSGKVKERAGASAESLLIRAPCGQVPREEEQRWLQDISFTDVDSETQVDENLGQDFPFLFLPAANSH
jgi:hypothetical protein